MSWYNTTKRKPRLQLQLMQLLSRERVLTKRQAEGYFINEAKISGKTQRPHYPEISHAFDALLEKKLVEPYFTSLTRGKPYRLTLQGLAVLIQEADSERESWTFVASFCLNMDNQKNLKSYSEFIKILDKFRERFIPYKSIGTYSYILKIFNTMSHKLLKEIGQDNTVRELLLILAKRREMTITEMESKTQMARSTIRYIIEMLSMDTSSFTNNYSLLGGDEIDPVNNRRRYIDFLQHCIIFYQDIDDKRNYHLSLFGVLFLINMLSANSANNRQFQKVLDMVAVLYPKKLPLIFGKWQSLRKCLNLRSMSNFESVLFSKEQESYSAEELSELGYDIEYDNKLIQNIYRMYVSNSLEWNKLLYIGMKMLYDIRDNKFSDFNIRNEIKTNELVSLSETWEGYLDFRRRLLNIETSIDEIFQGIKMHEKKLPRNMGVDVLYNEEDHLLPIKLMEKAFEDEVTLIYYLKLIDSFLNPTAKILQNEKEKLKQLFTEDDEIRNLYKMFLEESSNFHEEELNNIKTISDSLELSLGKGAGIRNLL